MVLKAGNREIRVPMWVASGEGHLLHCRRRGGGGGRGGGDEEAEGEGKQEEENGRWRMRGRKLFPVSFITAPIPFMGALLSFNIRIRGEHKHSLHEILVLISWH